MNGMETRIQRQRLRQIAEAVKGPFSVGRLAGEAGVSSIIFTEGYPSDPSAATLMKIAAGMASMVHGVLPSHLQAGSSDQWAAWLVYCQPDPSIERLLAELGDLRHCRRCGRLVHCDDFYARLGRCRDCENEEARTDGFRRRLAKNPELADYYQKLQQQQPEAEKVDPPLGRLIGKILAAGRALRKTDLTKELGVTRTELEKRWRKAALPTFLVGAFLAAGVPPGRKRRPGEAAAEQHLAPRPSTTDGALLGEDGGAACAA